MSTSNNPFAAQDAAFLRRLVVPRDDTNGMRVQEYKGCVGIACHKSNLLFAHLVEQLGQGQGIGKAGVARLIRTATVHPLFDTGGVIVFWRNLPWQANLEEPA